jgi:hypothetical protein
LDKNDKYPEKIDQKLVHKQDIENVIISKAQKFGNIWHFNMFPKIKEFDFDHESDHVQGMLLTEAARQTAIATAHLNGLSIEGKLNMSNMCTKFNNYVEYGSPVIIRSISNEISFDEEQLSKVYVIVNLMQFGKICTTTHFEGIAFKSKNDMEEYRKRSMKINEKVEAKYQNLLNEIRK